VKLRLRFLVDAMIIMLIMCVFLCFIVEYGIEKMMLILVLIVHVIIN